MVIPSGALGMEALREIAARYRLRYLLLYREVLAKDTRLEPWAWGYATIVGALFLPGKRQEVYGYTEVSMFDVKTGLLDVHHPARGHREPADEPVAPAAPSSPSWRRPRSARSRPSSRPTCSPTCAGSRRRPRPRTWRGSAARSSRWSRSRAARAVTARRSRTEGPRRDQGSAPCWIQQQEQPVIGIVDVDERRVRVVDGAAARTAAS